ncbi:PH domain-containing protein, partial [Duncaniella freteri]|uniref:PH domain-containing protein n=3 Tax=Muribaculaceae TaxID=2005473 RepID=UPI0025787C6F
MTDFSTPRRMSPGAFVIMFLKSFKDIVGAAFVVLVYMLYNSHDSGGRLFWKFALAAGIILTYSLAVAFTRYYFRKFHIEGDKLIYTRGLAEKQTTSIPLSRIHTLRTKRG